MFWQDLCIQHRHMPEKDFSKLALDILQRQLQQTSRSDRAQSLTQRQLLEKPGVQGQIAKECAYDECPLLLPQSSCIKSLGRQPSFLGNTKIGQKLE